MGSGGGDHFVVNSGFEKALPFFVEDIIILGHQNEPFCRVEFVPYHFVGWRKPFCS